MPVQITITGDNAKEALQEIGGLASALVGSTPSIDKPAKAKSQTAPKTEQRQEAPAKEDTMQSDPDPDENSEEIPDDVKLRAAAAEAAKTAGKVKVKALLDEYGVSNVTAVPADKRLDFLRDLEGLS